MLLFSRREHPASDLAAWVGWSWQDLPPVSESDREAGINRFYSAFLSPFGSGSVQKERLALHDETTKSPPLCGDVSYWPGDRWVQRRA